MLPTAQTAVASGDLNKDGMPDLVIGGDPAQFEGGKITVMLGKGNGNFHPRQEYRVGYNPDYFSAPFVLQILVGDLNNDGNSDVVVAHNGERSQNGGSDLLATVLLGDGQGNLHSTKVFPFFDGGSKAVTAIDFTDFNRDGKIDIVLGCESGNLGKVFGLRNLGNGNFQPIGPKTIGIPILKMQSAFANNDANPDLIITSPQGILVLYGDGGFYSPSSQELDRGIYDIGLVVKDFNADGNPDIAVTEQFKPSIRVFLGSQTGYPVNPIIYETAFLSSLIKSDDFNGDGKDDLIIVNGLGGTFQIFYGTGNGAFDNPEIINNTLPVSDIVTADFDLNRKIDIAASLMDDTPSNQAAVFLNAPNPSRFYTDFDGDAKSDFTIFRPNTATWWTLFSKNSSYSAINFGMPSDKIVAGNYDGDNKADIGVFRDGVWYILQSSDNSIKTEYWGLKNDIPAPADYDNNGKTNFAVFRPSDGVWYIKKDNGFDAIKWGINGDKPVPTDYDGDGKTDVAIYRPSDGVWYIRLGSTDEIKFQQFGLAEDIPVQSDFDGDGKADIAVYRPSSSYWYILQSKSQNIRYEKFGTTDDIPVPSDFDGDSKSDIAVFRPSNGIWYMLKTKDKSFDSVKWGTGNDNPLPVN